MYMGSLGIILSNDVSLTETSARPSEVSSVAHSAPLSLKGEKTEDSSPLVESEVESGCLDALKGRKKASNKTTMGTPINKINLVFLFIILL
jgi:hypothetical protein